MYFREKTLKALREGGVGMLFFRTYRFSKQKLERRLGFYSNTSQNKQGHTLKEHSDVLIVNGCHLLAPTRYRVLHVIEQFRFQGVSVTNIFRDDLKEEHIRMADSLLFYRCPSSTTVEKCIDLAKQQNKPVFFDIDDLIFDEKFVSTIEHLNNLNEKELSDYFWHVRELKNTLALCDFATAPTSEIATELKKYVKDVCINRNQLNVEQLGISEKVLKAKKEQLDEESDVESNLVRIGYLSGSITHNPDLELISEPLGKLLDKYEYARLVVVGNIDVPDNLARHEDNIERLEFCDWKELPLSISKIDINIAPLIDTKFNRGKSEIKWLEAAAVKVPTIASDVGSFADQIKSGRTGLLCKDNDEWFDSLEKMVVDANYRNEIAENAYNLIHKERGTQFSGYEVSEYLRSKLSKKIGFVIPTLNLSGGLRVILKHAKFLKNNGWRVLLIVDGDTEKTSFEYEGCKFDLIGKRQSVITANFDILVATLWTTVNFVSGYTHAKNKVYLVQNYEVNFHPYHQLGRRLAASATYRYPNINFLSISNWCTEWLASDYSVNASYVPNGIDSEHFAETSANRQRILSPDDEIHVLVEGNDDDEYKNVEESIVIFRKLKEIFPNIKLHRLAYRALEDIDEIDYQHFQVPFDEVKDIYARCDLLIKSSRLESFSYPPLEMMASGGFAVVAGNGGNAEYLVHKDNALVYTQGNIEEAVEQVKMLLNSPEMQKTLRFSGNKTAQARDWSTIEPKILGYYNQLITSTQTD